MTPLIGQSRTALAKELAGLGESAFRAKQVWHWIYNRGARSFAEMTTLSKPLREKLDSLYSLKRPDVLDERTSQDGARKWLFGFADGKSVEGVYIPEEDRGAVCLSTQAGCPLKCAFCRTGTLGFARNLTPGEIVGQFMAARDSYGEWPSPVNETRLLSNIVLMGMGEPLLNYDAVKEALKILSDGDGLAISKRRITLSTAGIAPMIPKVAEELGVKLAVSLHAPADELRDRLMPVNKKYPLAALKEACLAYQAAASDRMMITMEYVMLDGVNDSPADARALVNFVAGLRVKFNLIPYNGWEGSEFRPSSPQAVEVFSAFLQKAGYAAPVRVSRGKDISAACGQLAGPAGRDRHGRGDHLESSPPSSAS